MKRFLATIMTMAIIVSLSAPAMAVNDDGKYNGSSYVNMLSYTDEDSALTGGCSEALGYAGYAFEAKYITKNYPNLSLPVSGPSYTWDV